MSKAVWAVLYKISNLISLETFISTSRDKVGMGNGFGRSYRLCKNLETEDERLHVKLPEDLRLGIQGTGCHFLPA